MPLSLLTVTHVFGTTVTYVPGTFVTHLPSLYTLYGEADHGYFQNY